MAKAWDIVGYTYNADIYCRECMWEIAVNWVDLPEDLHEKARHMGVEDALDLLAKQLGVDRHDERSYDSGDFPKVVFESQACDEEHDFCGGCNGKLCEQ